MKKEIYFLSLFFIFISIIYCLYSIFSQNGLFADGAYFFLQDLINISNDKIQAAIDPEHTRKATEAIQQLPVLILGNLFQIKSKLVLSYIFSFDLYAIPLILLFLHYKLTKRTKLYGVLLWDLFSYATSLIYGIYSVTETIIGSRFYFLLLNYLLAKIKYSIFDKIFILFLLVIMMGIFEHTIFIGILFFIGACFCVFKDDLLKNSKSIKMTHVYIGGGAHKEGGLSKSSKLTKMTIGIGSLFASIYTINYMCKIPGEASEITRFINDLINTFPNILFSNAIFFIITIGCLFYFYFTRLKEIKNRKTFLIMTGIYSITFLLLIMKLIEPKTNIECKTRIISCISDTIIIFGIIFYHCFQHSKQIELIKRAYIPVLLFASFISLYQVLNCYFYNIGKNHFINNKIDKYSSYYMLEGFRLPAVLILKKEYNITINPELYPILIKDIKTGHNYYKWFSLKTRFYDMTELIKAMDEYMKNQENDEQINLYEIFGQ